MIVVIRRVIEKTVINRTVELGQQNFTHKVLFPDKEQLTLHELSVVYLKMRCRKDKIFNWTKKVKEYDMQWSAVMIIPVHQLKKVFDKCPNHRIKQQRETILVFP